MSTDSWKQHWARTHGGKPEPARAAGTAKQSLHTQQLSAEKSPWVCDGEQEWDKNQWGKQDYCHDWKTPFPHFVFNHKENEKQPWSNELLLTLKILQRNTEQKDNWKKNISFAVVKSLECGIDVPSWSIQPVMVILNQRTCSKLSPAPAQGWFRSTWLRSTRSVMSWVTGINILPAKVAHWTRTLCSSESYTTI